VRALKSGATSEHYGPSDGWLGLGLLTFASLADDAPLPS